MKLAIGIFLAVVALLVLSFFGTSAASLMNEASDVDWYTGVLILAIMVALIVGAATSALRKKKAK